MIYQHDREKRFSNRRRANAHARVVATMRVDRHGVAITSDLGIIVALRDDLRNRGGGVVGNSLTPFGCCRPEIYDSATLLFGHGGLTRGNAVVVAGNLNVAAAAVDFLPWC